MYIRCKKGINETLLPFLFLLLFILFFPPYLSINGEKRAKKDTNRHLVGGNAFTPNSANSITLRVRGNTLSKRGEKKVHSAVRQLKKSKFSPQKNAMNEENNKNLSNRKSKFLTTQKSKLSTIIQVRCRNRLKFGNFCVGRVIGPLVRDEIVKCPLCGKPVLVRRLLRPWSSWNYDSDLRPFSNKRFRQVHRVWTCRLCGYSALYGDFFVPFTRKKVKEALKPIKRKFGKFSQITPEYRFQTAAAVYWARGSNAAFFAELFLRAAWSMREEKRPEKERLIFISRTISATEIALKRGLYSDEKKLRSLYLLAELYRQIRRFTKAKHYLELSEKYLNKYRNSLKKEQIKTFKSYILQLRPKILNRDPHPFTLK